MNRLSRDLFQCIQCIVRRVGCYHHVRAPLQMKLPVPKLLTKWHASALGIYTMCMARRRTTDLGSRLRQQYTFDMNPSQPVRHFLHKDQ